MRTSRFRSKVSPQRLLNVRWGKLLSKNLSIRNISLIVIAYHLVAYFRFLYGQVREFKDVQFAIDVFKFAHEMQITSLMHALSKFFETNGTGNALLFYEICTQLDYQQGSQMCKKVRKQIHFSSKVLSNRHKFQGVKIKKICSCYIIIHVQQKRTYISWFQIIAHYLQNFQMWYRREIIS